MKDKNVKKHKTLKTKNRDRCNQGTQNLETGNNKEYEKGNLRRNERIRERGNTCPVLFPLERKN